MILVFGGTTEGKLVLAALAAANQPCWYSSKIKIDVSLPAGAQYRYGAFTQEALEAFCLEQHITTIVHASHPFAALLHETIGIVSQRLSIPVIRFERHYPETPLHPLVRYADSYEEVLSAIHHGGYEPVLSLTGVQTIIRWRPYWERKKMYCRILPRDTSVAIARDCEFPEEQLLLSFPGKTVEEELQVVKETGVQAIITKESGESGYLSVKIDTAIAAGIPLYIIRRPALPPHFVKVDTTTDMLKHIIHTAS
ncbi:precorrin-6A/cobalt-precorrin-6A reductase [Chitinophaga sp. HK235]|uniref:precorrin-6A/cobalt-precorrin-6A reductase n=1 Tax=Chitinophaga sp. HK235 TaxID=2952571 RepID=UPI001BABF814|nr:precorrin-6A/cobalt-precorrin-6A reductase [Chitinophaga sp. HK235]